jgi:hypothetical protein
MKEHPMNHPVRCNDFPDARRRALTFADDPPRLPDCFVHHCYGWRIATGRDVGHGASINYLPRTSRATYPGH